MKHKALKSLFLFSLFFILLTPWQIFLSATTSENSAETSKKVKSLIREGKIHQAIETYRKIKLEDREHYPLVLITRPEPSTKHWYGRIEGVAFGIKSEWRIEVFIRTDVEYDQGTALLRIDDTWVLYKTWPSPGISNTVYAKVFDDRGKLLFVSNDVLIVP